MSRSFAVIALALMLSACAKSQKPATVRTSSDVLTRQEIAAVPVDNAYDAVNRLRPMFLRPRSIAGSQGGQTTAYAVVFVDGVRRGPLEVLRSIMANSVAEIRYISALDGTTRYGLNLDGGVIQVTLIGR